MDSPPFLAAVPDPRDGGRFTLEPTVPYRVKRRYLLGSLPPGLSHLGLLNAAALLNQQG